MCHLPDHAFACLAGSAVGRRSRNVQVAVQGGSRRPALSKEASLMRNRLLRRATLGTATTLLAAGAVIGAPGTSSAARSTGLRPLR